MIPPSVGGSASAPVNSDLLGGSGQLVAESRGKRLGFLG